MRRALNRPRMDDVKLAAQGRSSSLTDHFGSIEIASPAPRKESREAKWLLHLIAEGLESPAHHLSCATSFFNKHAHTSPNSATRFFRTFDTACSRASTATYFTDSHLD